MIKKISTICFNIILTAITLSYGSAIFANDRSPYLHDNKSSHNYYIKIGVPIASFATTISSPSQESALVLNLSASAGYMYELQSTNRFRTELELYSIAVNVINRQINGFECSQILSINGYYDISMSKIKGLYINFGSGIGVKRTKSSLTEYAMQTTYSPVIKLKSGLEYQLTDHLSISSELRGELYYNTSSVDFSLIPSTGLKYTF